MHGLIESKAWKGEEKDKVGKEKDAIRDGTTTGTSGFSQKQLSAGNVTAWFKLSLL